MLPPRLVGTRDRGLLINDKSILRRLGHGRDDEEAIMARTDAVRNRWEEQLHRALRTSSPTITALIYTR